MKTYKKFSDFDMFGYNVGLYFNGNIKESTLFSMIFTMIYILTFIIITIYYITQTFSKKNYTFSTSTIKHDGITSIKLEKDIFALYFALEEPVNYLEYIDETIYYIKANLVTGIKDPNTQTYSWYYEEIKTGPCSLDMFEKDNQHFFKGYKNNYCLYDIDKKNLTGHFVFDHYSKIIISFYPCINSTENNNHCKSQDIIDYYLNNTYFSMILQSITIDEDQIPMTETYIENPYTTVNQYSFTSYQIFLKIVETEDDTGIIFNSKKYKKILQYDSTSDMFSLNRKVNDGNSFCQITIKLSDKKTVYKRKFEKVQDAFSKAGSLMTLIYSFIQICSWLPMKTVYEVNVINKVFKFDINTTKNKIMNENYISRYIMNFNNENYVKKNINNNNDLNVDVIKNENDENIKEMNRDNTNMNFVLSKNYSNSNVNKLNIKTNDLSLKVIRHSNGNNMFVNNLVKNRSFKLKQAPNIFREDSENNQYKWKKRKRWSIESEKRIFDFIKFNCCQLFCYYPIRHCSNNIKNNLAKNAQKFFRKNMDVISVFQNVVTGQKIFKLVAKNQRIFGIYDRERYYYNNIINNNKIENDSKKIRNLIFEN